MKTAKKMLQTAILLVAAATTGAALALAAAPPPPAPTGADWYAATAWIAAWTAVGAIVAVMAVRMNGCRKRLISEQERLERLIARIPAVVWSVDDQLRLRHDVLHGDVLQSDVLQSDVRHSEVLAGRPGPAELRRRRGGVGTALSDYLGVDGLHPVVIAHRQALAGRSGRVELQLDGRWFECRVEPQLDERGTTCGVVAVAVDVTDSRRAAQELRLAKELADQGNEAKTRFLAMMSHEIRTPLTAIRGFLDLVLEGEAAPEERDRFVGVARRSATQLSQLVDDLLDLSKAETNRLDMEATEVDLHGLIHELTGSLGSWAQSRGVALRIELGEPLAPRIRVDRARLMQILSNVIGNAVKFTERGSISATLRMRPIGRGKALLEAVVVDTGIGITAEHRERLFQPFVQGDASLSRRYGGVGLGLALARYLARAMGGDVELLESFPGHGSTFRVVLQVATLSEEWRRRSSRAAAAGDGPLSGRRLLVVEDVIDNQILLDRYLRDLGGDVTLCNNGREGVDAALQEDFDLILMDVVMPVMDGFAAAAELRRHGYDRPIVALSAHAMKGAREEALRRGFNDYLTKPIDREHLTQVLTREFHGTSTLAGLERAAAASKQVEP